MFRCQATRPRCLFLRSVRSGCASQAERSGAMAKKNDARSEAGAADAEPGKTAPAKRKLSFKLIIMTVAGVVGLAAVGGGGYYLFAGGHGKAEAAAVAETSPAKSV